MAQISHGYVLEISMLVSQDEILGDALRNRQQMQLFRVVINEWIHGPRLYRVKVHLE